MTPTKLLIGQILLVFAIVLLGVWAATQWAAAMLDYQPELGQPWFLIAGQPIYRPWALFPWWYHFDAYAPHVFDRAGALAGTSGFLGCAAAIFGSLWRARQAANVTTYGSPNMLNAGTIISASLITGLDSDLPGNVIAQVTAPVYDSVTGRTALIPQGSRIIGSYDSVVAFGQRRALVVWQRLILPDGSSVRIDNWPASDLQGYAGLADKIDRHTWQLLKGVALATLLGVGTEVSFSRESDLVEAIRESTQQNSARAGDQLVRKNLDVQPTIRVRPGWPLTVIVHKDLVLPPWRGK